MLAGRQAGRLERLGGNLGAVVEAVLERRQVDRLGMGPEGSNGIDIFLFGPRSFRIRMWIGF